MALYCINSIIIFLYNINHLYSLGEAYNVQHELQQIEVTILQTMISAKLGNDNTKL